QKIPTQPVPKVWTQTAAAPVRAARVRPSRAIKERVTQLRAMDAAPLPLLFFALQDRGRSPAAARAQTSQRILASGSSSPQRGEIFIENGPLISSFLILRRRNVTTCLQNDWLSPPQ